MTLANEDVKMLQYTSAEITGPCLLPELVNAFTKILTCATCAHMPSTIPIWIPRLNCTQCVTHNQCLFTHVDIRSADALS